MSNCTAVRIPGPQGPASSNGTNGADGLNAFSLVAAAFAVPAAQATVVVTLTDPPGNRWMEPAQVVAVQGAGTGGNRCGYYEVVSLTGTNIVTLLNLRNNPTSAYQDNLDASGTIVAGMKISPAGIQGPQGTAPAGFLQSSHNLDDVDSVSAARANLGLGALATQNSVNDGSWSGTDLSIPNGGTGASDAATARTNLGAAVAGAATASGLTIGSDKVLGRSTPGAGALEEIACTAAGRALMGAASVAAQLAALGKVLPRYGLLGVASGIALDASGNDNAVTIGATSYRIDKVTVIASGDAAAGTAGVFTAAGGGGTTLATDQALAALSSSSKFHDLTLEAIVGTDLRTEATLYFRTGTAGGAGITGSVWVWGYRFD